MKALSNGRNQKHCGQENRDTHVIVSSFSGFCASIGHLRSLLIQTKELLMLGIVILGHEDRARRRLRILERVGAQPGCECGAVLVAKAPLKELRGLFFTIQLRGEPTVEGVAVVDPLLPCHGDKSFTSDPEPSRLGVLLRTLSSPLCCLVPAPRGGHGNEGEDQRFENFNRFKTGLRTMTALAHLV